MPITLFIFGLLIGSFLNVLASRYNPDTFILNRSVIGGRSRCDSCGNQLRFYELVPVLSFLIQGGRCRHCKVRLSFQYPVVEILSGLIFLIIPWRLISYGEIGVTELIWITTFLTLLLISLIDLRLRIIPDELNLLIVILAIPLIYAGAPFFSPTSDSFIGHYAMLFGGRENIWLNHFLGLLFGLGFFLILILITRGRGMGGGDMKLAGALGFLFGWPDIFVIIPLSFVLGSLFALPLLLLRRRKRKDFLPFGPFLAISAWLVFMWGLPMVNFYFGLFRV